MRNILDNIKDPHPLIRIYNECVDHLRTGPVIIGESHGYPHGRVLAMDLFEEGCVKIFFFEFPNFPMTQVLGGGHDLPPSENYLNGYLARLVGTSYESDKFWEDFKIFFSVNLSTKIESIKKMKLVEEALHNNIKIVFYEDANLWAKTGGQDFVLRNQRAAEEFNSLTSEEKRGVLILCGSSHTESNNSIQRLMGIEDYRVKNMSPYTD